MTITQQRLFSSSKSPLRTKLFFQLLLPLFLLMGVGGFLIYRSATASLQKAHHEAHLTMRKALVDLVELSYDLTEQEVSMDVRVARAMIVPHVSLSNAQIPVEAVNQKTRESQKMDIPEMALDGKLALGDKIWVDSISRLLGNHVAVTLFQVIPGGMLRVSTTVKTSDGKRATGTYIPESSPVYQKIMSGQRFQGRAMVADEWYVTAYEPLLHQGKVIGALFAGVPQGKMDVLRHRIVSFRVGEHGFAQIIDTAGKQIIHPDSTLEGSIRKSAHHQYMLQEKEGDIISKQQSNLNGKKGSFVDYAFARIPEMQWIVSACAYQDELLAPVRTMQKLISVVMLACLLLAFFLTSTFSRGLTRRLEATSSALREIASGEADLTRRLPLKKGDEFMELAQSFNRFTERLQQMIQRVAESTRTLQGNADHLSKESHQLNQNMESLRSQALSMATDSQEANKGLTESASATESTSSNLRDIASAIEEMSTSLKQVAAHCKEESQVATEAKGKTANAAETMTQLSQVATSVNQIVGLIDDIAEQTNLLALNAAIEAATAGEAGKGFAVVAGEVKQLARQTAEATQSIRSQIENMNQQTNNAVDALKEIHGIVESLDSLSSQISISISEQSSVIGGVSHTVANLSQDSVRISQSTASSANGVNNISQNLGYMKSDVAQSAQSMGQISTLADQVAELSRELENEVSGFKT